MTAQDRPLWSRDVFLDRLRDVGRRAYHDKHPFHVVMNDGGLTRAQVRGWVANRFHYQRNIPIKDAAILSNCPFHEVRRGWVRRLIVHDGNSPGEGGIEAWLRLGEAVGLARAELLDARHVLPGVRAAVDDYVRLARDEPWPVAVASSLTELFAPDLMAERLRGFERYYTWIPPWGLEYFRARLTQARIDSDEGLELTLTHCDTPDLQDRAVAALERKCVILWSMLDAIMEALGPGQAQGGESIATVGEPPGSGPARPGPSDRYRLADGVRLRDDRHGGGTVLLRPEGVVPLNETGRAILALCDGLRTVGEIVAALAETHDAPAPVVEADVIDFLHRLGLQGLVRSVPDEDEGVAR